MILTSCFGEYIHPYGKGFIFYTDKKWVEGKADLFSDKIVISGKERIIIPFLAILSLDKKIALPVVKEGRSTLLIEYIDIKSRERIYTLFSSEGSCVREFKKKLLQEIVKRISISVKKGDRWERTYLQVEDYVIKFVPSGQSFHISSIIEMYRRSIEIGFNKVSAITLKIDKGEESEEILIITPPLKRDFFWQLLNLLMEEYINTQILMKLTNREKLFLQMLDEGWSYQQIQAKLEIPEKEMEELLKKLEHFGIVKKIIIVKLTDRGKTVLQFIPSQEFE